MSFDCYGTLVDWETGLERSVLWVLRTKPDAPGIDKVVEAWNRHERALTSGKEGYRRYRDVIAEALRLSFDELGVAWQPRDGYALAHDMGSWPAFDDVPGSLAQLRDLGYKLAIFSNTDDDILADTVKTLGVAPDLALTAEQVKAYKPDARVFLEGAKRLGLQPSQVLHCSFSPYHDLEPAHKLGFRTFFVDRKGFGESEVPVDFQGRDLRALVELLGT